MHSKEKHEKHRILYHIVNVTFSTILATIDAMLVSMFEIAYRKSDSRSNNLFRAFVFAATTLEKPDSQN